MKELLKTIPLFILKKQNLGLKGAMIKAKEITQIIYRKERR